MRVVLAGLLLVALGFSGCRESAPPTAPAPSDRPESEQQPHSDAMTMRGIDLYMHPRVLPEGIKGMPELWVQAETFSVLGTDAYSFEDARAVIYSGKGDEEIVIEAQRGNFHQGKSARLEGDVFMTAGTLRMQLRDIEWVHPDDEGTLGEARSDNPVIIDDPDLQLNAASLRIYPDTQMFELTDVSGVMRFGRSLL